MHHENAILQNFQHCNILNKHTRSNSYIDFPEVVWVQDITEVRVIALLITVLNSICPWHALGDKNVLKGIIDTSVASIDMDMLIAVLDIYFDQTLNN